MLSKGGVKAFETVSFEQRGEQQMHLVAVAVRTQQPRWVALSCDGEDVVVRSAQRGRQSVEREDLEDRGGRRVLWPSSSRSRGESLHLRPHGRGSSGGEATWTARVDRPV